MSVILALPRFVARMWRRFSSWLNPSADQRVRSTLHKRDARQKDYDALREHYPRGGGPGWR